jgi:hypothetical protein
MARRDAHRPRDLETIMHAPIAAPPPSDTFPPAATEVVTDARTKPDLRDR